MGSGKSVFLAELARCLLAGPREVIVITTPTLMLVEQLLEDLQRRLGARQVGAYCSGHKDWRRQVIVTTIDSVSRVAQILKAGERTCALLICDEAHRSECATQLDAVEQLAPKLVVGLTATPFRSKAKERLSLFGRLVYDYSMADAIRDQVLVPVEVMAYEGDEDVHRDQACLEMIESIICTRDVGPGIVSADNIADAEEFAGKLRDHGIRAAAVHSGNKTHKMKRSEVKAAMRDLEKGTLDAVVHVSLLTEGANYLWLGWLCMRRKSYTPVAWAQEAGRVMRTYKGKVSAVIADPWRHFENHTFAVEASILPSLPGVIAYVDESLSPARAEQWAEDNQMEVTTVVRSARELLEAVHTHAVQTCVVATPVHRKTLLRDVKTLLPRSFEVMWVWSPGASGTGESDPDDPDNDGPDHMIQARNPIEAWLSREVFVLEQRGTIRRRMTGLWREQPATIKQHNQIRIEVQKLNRRRPSLPDYESAQMRAAVKRAFTIHKRPDDMPTRGFASDLITMLQAIRAVGGWPIQVAPIKAKEAS